MKTHTISSLTLLDSALTQWILLIVGAVLFMGTVDSRAAETPPERMTYQGFLVDANGTPLGNTNPANHTVVFRIYDQSQGGNVIWSEVQVVTVDKGLFSVLLGEGAQFQNEPHGNLSAAFVGSTADVRWIGITATDLGANEVAPRLRLLTSPYAFLAQSAVSLASGGTSFLSKSGNNVSVGGDLRLTSDGTEFVVFPRSNEVVIGNSRDVPTRISGQLQVTVGNRTVGLNPNDSGHTRFSANPAGAYIFDGRLNTTASGNWGEFQPTTSTMLMNTSAVHWSFKDDSGRNFTQASHRKMKKGLEDIL